MKLEWIDVLIFSIYIVGIVLLGLYASRSSSDSKRDYFLAGDKLPWWMIGGSIIAANISSHHLVGPWVPPTAGALWQLPGMGRDFNWL